MREHVLVVTPDNARLNVLLRVLIDAGYDARGAVSFVEAKRLLGTDSPELIIADERLGDFNGLHLAMLGRARAPHTKAIVVSRRKDPGLENEARRLHVPCLVAPSDPSEWLPSIWRTLAHADADDPVTTAHEISAVSVH